MNENNTKKLRAAIYSRVSTEDQGNGYSLTEQERSLVNYCTRKKHELVVKYQEEHSAKDFNRPKFQEFLRDLSSGKLKIDLLVCVRVDRFSRNLHEALEMQTRLKKLGVTVEFVDRNYDDNNPEDLLIRVIDLALAQVYNERLSVNTINGMRQASREGKWMGKALIGYKNNKVLKTIEVDPLMAPYIRRAFEMMSTGIYTAEEIRAIFRTEGKYFTKQTFLNILRNKFYAGVIFIKSWRNEPAMEVKGIHEPLISEQLFNRVQNVFNTRKRANGLSDTRRSELPLRGHLNCPDCGRLLTGSASRSRNKELHYYYHCQHKYKCNHRRKASFLHHKLYEHMDSFKIPTEVKELYLLILERKFQTTEEQKSVEKKEISRQKAAVLEKLESLTNKFIDNDIDKLTYQNKKQEYDLSIQELECRAENLESQNSAFSLYWRKGTTLIDNLTNFYRHASLEVKQKIVGSIFPQNLVYNEKEYRTSPVNEALLLITRTFNELGENKNKNATDSDGVFKDAPPPGLEPGTP